MLARMYKGMKSWLTPKPPNPPAELYGGHGVLKEDERLEKLVVMIEQTPVDSWEYTHKSKSDRSERSRITISDDTSRYLTSIDGFSVQVEKNIHGVFGGTELLICSNTTAYSLRVYADDTRLGSIRGEKIRRLYESIDETVKPVIEKKREADARRREQQKQHNIERLDQLLGTHLKIVE